MTDRRYWPNSGHNELYL